jgi:hypothetical protein
MRAFINDGVVLWYDVRAIEPDHRLIIRLLRVLEDPINPLYCIPSILLLLSQCPSLWGYAWRYTISLSRISREWISEFLAVWGEIED